MNPTVSARRKVFQHHLAHCRVERGEEFVLGEHLAFGKQVHQSRLPHVGVAHEGDADESPPVLALGGLLFVNLHQSLLQQGDALEDDAAVHLQLRLTRTAESHGTFAAAGARTATLALQVGPQPLQAREHVAILGQLHLCLGVGGLGTHGENVENQRGTVQYLHFQHLFDIAQLLGTQLIVENHHAYFTFCILLGLDEIPDFIQLPFSHITHLAGTVQSLGETFHRDDTGGIGQKLQFIKVFLCLRLVLVLCYQTHQDGGLGLYLGNDKFFHNLGMFITYECHITIA